jgi:hypothetical protein
MRLLEITFLAALIAVPNGWAMASPPQKPMQIKPGQPRPVPPKPPPVHAEGCVEPGAEARCLVVKDLRNGVLYNLIVKGLPPAIGDGIEFSGLPHNGVTTCMQGIAIDVQTWAHRNSLKCMQNATPRK